MEGARLSGNDIAAAGFPAPAEAFRVATGQGAGVFSAGCRFETLGSGLNPLDFQ